MNGWQGGRLRPNGNITPGQVVEPIRLSGVTTNELSTVEAVPTLRPVLGPNSSCFISVSNPIVDQLRTVGWGAGDAGDTGFVRATEWYTGAWAPNAHTANPRPAMRIQGTIIPEPGSGWLFSTGLAALGARRRQPEPM